jgi:hypothetical protein
MSSREKPILLPARVRAGAAYRCFGDGLCCTDIHGLGPLTKLEVRAVKKIDREGAGYAHEFEDDMLRVAADGGCRFLLPNQYCNIHVVQGPQHKPHGCTKFPYGFVATPSGGRIFTEHRCPCRTLGERPPLSVETALESIRDGEAELDSDADIDSVKLAPKRRIPFRRWEAIETPMLAALAQGVHPADALSAKPFPRLAKTTWKETGDEFVDARDGSRFGFAIAWFGDTILHLREGTTPREPLRPWADAFDRAEARSPNPRTAREVLNDFVSDHLWSVKWADKMGFETFGAEIATRVAVAESISTRLAARGLRADRAMAEAVTIVELVGSSEYWERLVPRMRP